MQLARSRSDNWCDYDTGAQDLEKDNARWHCSCLKSANLLDDHCNSKESHPQSLPCCAYVRRIERRAPCAMQRVATAAAQTDRSEPAVGD